MPPTGGDPLSPAERAEYAALRGAESLADLVAVTGAADEHDAYFAAKDAHRDLAARAGRGPGSAGGLPGRRVVLDGADFWVHGVTHADTDAERDFLRDHVHRILDGDAVVYAEQGVRPMYFRDVDGVCAMDDYAWATRRCAAMDCDSHVDLPDGAFEGVREDVASLAARFREAAFSLVDAGSSVYGEAFEAALGDLATSFLTSHEDAATGRDFASFKRSARAARDPSRLAALQAYYERAFLPQPVEREWLRRHDPELEVVTHARNERMADYAVYHHDSAASVHLVVGAAHQPGVAYYLREHAAGDRSADGFELAR
ncbi:hypothetical protein [Halobacterium yunchengense]|uniref:hypothetical protein n=1 Tax=Halobacterium yunchengense TaxID=3108497 RepID=UPI00300981B4